MVEDKTHFGYQTVDASEKAAKVADVFHSVASNYDLMNDLMSMGVHRLWKRYTVELAGIKPGQTILDLAGGTGDLAALMAPKVGDTGKVIVSDINESMLNVGRDRLTNKGLVSNLEYVQANAECLPFADNTFDCVTIAFGLRNVTDKQKALESMRRVIKPGGRLLVLEFSKPTTKALQKIYDQYSFKLLPKMGELFANDAESYQYLAESIRMHPDQETLKGMILEAGFDECDVHNLTGGIVALHRGFYF
jgi:demethylmenaquinone methyltransferase / 2-methoxy-6-polyprenyl-1,4-benzoquinol methylase